MPVADNPSGIYNALLYITRRTRNNAALMTPLRVDQAFNEKFKVIDGVLNVYENGEWVQYDRKM